MQGCTEEEGWGDEGGGSGGRGKEEVGDKSLPKGTDQASNGNPDTEQHTATGENGECLLY